MSTFAVFGMTRAVALADAKKKTEVTRENREAPGGREAIPMDEWLQIVERTAARTMEGSMVRQLSPLFDAPQYAEQFIALARKAGPCRDLRIKAKAVLKDAQGKTIIDPKTKAPKYGFAEWGGASTSAVA